MDSNSTQEEPPSPPGSSLPVRAPLTLDSDSELNNQILCRTSSFSSSSSNSIDDISSYASQYDEKLVTDPDEEIVIESSHVEEHAFTRPFLKHPDGNYAKRSSFVDESSCIRPSVRIPLSDIEKLVKPAVAGFGISSLVKFGVPVARLTGDNDGDDVDSIGSEVEVEEGRWTDSVSMIVEKVTMAPRVRIFDSYEADDDVLRYQGICFRDDIDELQYEGVCFCDDINVSNSVVNDSVSAESFEDVGPKVEAAEKVECLNEVVKHSTSDEAVLGLDEDGDQDEMYFDDTIFREDQNNRVLDSHEEAILESNGSGSTQTLKLDNKAEHLEDEFKENVCKDECTNPISVYLEEDIGLCFTGLDCSMRSKDHKSPEILSDDEDVMHLVKEVRAFEAARQGDQEKTCLRVEVHDSDQSEKVALENKVSPDDDECPKIYNLYYDSEGEPEQRFTSEENSPTIDKTVSDSDIRMDVVEECEGVDRFRSTYDESKEIKDETQHLRVNFLRLVRLLGSSTEDSTVAQVLCRLGKQTPVDVKRDKGNNEFDFRVTILVIGKTGVGKSATINSILGENKALTNAFRPATTSVKEIVGNVDGVEVRILDTPGLRSSPSEQSHNRKTLASIKRFTRKQTPDVVLYVDRLDMHTRDLIDLHLLRSISSSLGPSVWCNCVIALTHSASVPDNKSYEAFVSHRCCFIQQLIASVGVSDGHTNPVCLVENHAIQDHVKSWKPRLLLLCYSVKMLHEAKLDEGGCDGVPSIKPSGETWIAVKLSAEWKKGCFGEYDYRVKLLEKKPWSLVCRLRSWANFWSVD